MNGFNERFTALNVVYICMREEIESHESIQNSMHPPGRTDETTYRTRAV